MTLDTNIIIAYLNGEEQVVTTLSKWQTKGIGFFLSTITETEVLSFPQFTPVVARNISDFKKIPNLKLLKI